jgi:hypothetical protein
MKQEGGSWDWSVALAFIACGSIGFVVVGAVSEFMGYGTVGELLLLGVFGGLLGASAVLLNRSR